MTEWEKLTYKKFSIGHPDKQTMIPENNFQGKLYYTFFKNSPQKTIDEIYDIYFGKFFHAKTKRGTTVSWGNVMGGEASDMALDWLFRVQEDFGIPLSLTMNQLNVPFDLYNDEDVVKQFIDWVGEFYNRGLRSITIGNTHLMNLGILKKNFPDMQFKNTVNHIVDNAQIVMDYIHIGYDLIQLDRQLNRNIEEIKKIKQAVENYNSINNKEIKTCLLLTESCVPFCPFKREHDDIQVTTHPSFGGYDYWSKLGLNTCTQWRSQGGYGSLPRAGTDVFANKRRTWKQFAELVDVFKFSGRLRNSDWESDNELKKSNKYHRWVWSCLPDYTEVGATIEQRSKIQEKGRIYSPDTMKKEVMFCNSFSEILENELEPLGQWTQGVVDTPYEVPYNIDKFKEKYKDHFHNSKRYLALEEKLKICKNQCWDCHLCEKTYDLEPIDSMIQFTNKY